MIRNLIKKFQAKRLGTPLKVSSDAHSSEWKVPTRRYVDENGDERRILEMETVCKLIIAEKIDNDDPKTVNALYKAFHEEARVRMIVRDELSKAQRRAKQQDQRKLIELVERREREQESPHQPARIASSAVRFQAQTLEETDDDGRPASEAENSAKIASISEAQAAKSEAQPEPAATPSPISLEEALSVIIDPAERALVEAYLNEHPLMKEFATSSRGTVRFVIRDGQVVRVGYREQISRRA